MRIAVVGSGISGLGAAYILACTCEAAFHMPALGDAQLLLARAGSPG